MTEIDERVVLLSDDGTPVGVAAKSDVHHRQTPLHFAFSCYVVDASGRVLVTRRALAKQTWPGVWTNSFCGHPAPFEPVSDAVMRRARHELGLELDAIQLVLPDFRYRAVDDSGIVENEICPVYVARAASPLAPNPDEVMAFEWVEPDDLWTAMKATPWAFSPWMNAQLRQLRGEGIFVASWAALS